MTFKYSLAVAVVAASLLSVSGCSTNLSRILNSNNEGDVVKEPKNGVVNSAVESAAAAMSVNGIFDESIKFKNTTTDDYDYTLRWKRLTPSGVALTTEGYVHVLAYEEKKMPIPNAHKVINQRELWDKAPTPKTKQSLIKEVMTPNKKYKPIVIKENKRINRDEAISPELMVAYKRLCNAGQDMTEKDWELVVMNGGLDWIPSQLKNCTPPK